MNKYIKYHRALYVRMKFQCCAVVILVQVFRLIQIMKQTNAIKSYEQIQTAMYAWMKLQCWSVVYQSRRQMRPVSEHYTLPSRPDTPICYPTLLSYCTTLIKILLQLLCQMQRIKTNKCNCNLCTSRNKMFSQIHSSV